MNVGTMIDKLAKMVVEDKKRRLGSPLMSIIINCAEESYIVQDMICKGTAGNVLEPYEL